MYTDEDLNVAVEKGIFSADAIRQFRHLHSTIKNAPAADQENFKLLAGFNDIFVVIACCLLLFSSWWMLESITESNSFGLLVMVIISWGLAEVFIIKKQLALPAIVLLLAFVGGVFWLCIEVFAAQAEDISIIFATPITILAAGLHWWRFQVPITIAAGAAAGVGLVVAIFNHFCPDAEHWWEAMVFVCGLLTFGLAMYWDTSDINRVTRRTDVSFWLHLLAAPLIIHPVFSHLGVLDGNENVRIMVIVILLYLLMTSISIVIDRRALMVSSLVYVIYALAGIVETYGGVGYSFAITGVIMGAMLLLLSVYWHTVRSKLVIKLPSQIRKHIPQTQEV